MKKNLVMTASLAVAGSLAAGIVLAAGTAHWGYSGHEGPEHWGELAAEFATCASGRNQSPIDVVGMVDGDLPAIEISYRAGGSEIVDNGHTIQVNYAPGSRISVDGHRFELKQFHFHSPSENTIEGRAYPMEGHFVHADADGNLAVIAVMFEEGAANAELEKAWGEMPAHAGERHALSAQVNAGTLLPSGRGYYRYNGSLTTPPCSEGVTWLVMKEAVTASKAQIAKFTQTLHHANNRPVQPLNARVVAQ